MRSWHSWCEKEKCLKKQCLIDKNAEPQNHFKLDLARTIINLQKMKVNLALTLEKQNPLYKE